ncbi:ABC transporter transmembrane domain-containing protein [Actinoplanes friuliensis]|uniref:ABC transporter permease n=1 Tax=Actinoplanes friuliensis DSM 7358 TaxID=1246995 RepID=U5VY78_9ACTN|nr:ABC transporter ATP-binding protein [Actinoplanes friuliensis]AGZ41953.1 ABC transporter permease [Actinoplanes friuliensis DSM 7358]
MTVPHPAAAPRRALLRSAVRGHLPVLGLILAVALLGSVAEALTPAAIGAVLNAATDGEGLAAGPVGVLAVLIVVAIVASVWRYAASSRLRIRVAFQLKQRLGLAVAGRARAIGREVSPGELATAMTSDTDAIAGYPGALIQLIASVVAFAVVAGYLLTSSLLLGAIVLVGVPLLMWTTTRVAEPLEGRQREQRRLLGRLGDLGSDIALGLRILRSIGAEQTFRTRYRETSRQARTAGTGIAGTEALIEAAKLLLPGVLLILVTWVGARLVLRGSIEPGELVAFYAAAAYLVEPLGALATFVTTRARSRVAADRVLRALAVDPPGWPGTGTTASGDLRDGTTGVEAAEGEFTVVAIGDERDAGALGARLAGLDPVDALTTTIGGVPIVALDRSALRRLVRLHGAEPTLFSGTLRANVDPGAAAADAAVAGALATAVATDVVDALPDGLTTVVGAQARTLSGGQRQRVALARAVLDAPAYLILVEPTSSLDTVTEVEVCGRIRAQRAGRTTVVVTTSPAFLEAADRVVFLAGEPIGGTHAELLATSEDYRTLVARENA